jgi:hypothetical protein
MVMVSRAAINEAALLLTLLAAANRGGTTIASSHVQFMAYYGCVPTAQHGHANLCIDDDKSTLVEARRLGMKGMMKVTWAFFRNAPPPRSGLMLREDYRNGWAQQWEARHQGLQPLVANGTVIGVFLGDELLGAGVNVTELTIAAETVKGTWPSAIVYWNEMWGPVVQNATWKHRASALSKVPDAIDWISLDFYRRDQTAWETPAKEYAAQVSRNSPGEWPCIARDAAR